MTNISITINKDEFEKINQKLNLYEINSHNEFILKIYKFNSTTVTIYKTMVLVLQGKDSLETYKFIFDKEYNEIDNQNSFDNKKLQINQYTIATMGSDEVGVGDFFGGIVVASAYVRKDQIQWLKDIGVKDSKFLSDEKIISIFENIKDQIIFNVINIFPEEYNNQFEIYNNSHIIKAVGHNQALWNLSKQATRPYFVIIDQFVSPENYSNYLRRANKSEFSIDIFETKAESKYMAVACASIIARYYFLEQIKSLSNHINVELILGSSNHNIISTAKQIIKDKGVDALNKVCKKHFITYKEVLEN